MQINLATIEQHAGEKLRRIATQMGAGERLVALKKFLKSETQRLQLRHRFGIAGTQIVAARSLIVDLLIKQIVRTAALERLGEAASGEPFAIVALGGYGRQELAPHSDIDIMLLHQGRKDAKLAAQLNEAVLYLLWDVGFTVGHSVRSMGECLTIAREDLVSRNSLIDARWLCGNAELFETLVERLHEEVFDKQKPRLLGELMDERALRYEKFSEAVCVQEPNIKETAGGLRDLHVLLWASRIAYEQRTLGGLLSEGIIPERDIKAIQSAYDFLLRVRNELHFLTGRRADLLALDLQQQAAANLGYQDTAQQQASEVFMRDYYLHARRLHRLCEAHLHRAVARHSRKSWFRRPRIAPLADGFVVREGMLEVAAATGATQTRLNGQRLMQAFAAAQSTGIPFSVAMQERIQASLPVVNRTFITSVEAAQSFLKILRAKGRVAAGLRLMHDLDFLGKFLPEFGRITCLVQHDLYHRYTVDEHTLRALETLDKLAASASETLDRYRTVYHEVKDVELLHLGLLLHDIGKGLGGGHTAKGIEIADKVCARLHLDAQATATVKFLIREHLTMSHISQRRDLADDQVIRGFAAQIGALENLNMLTLLTYGDINGVGAGVWNEWKDALLWELYIKARAVFEDAKRDVINLRDKIARMLSSEVDYNAVRHHFALLPPDYARSTPSQTIIEHVRLAHLLHTHTVKTTWRVNHQSRCTDLHLCARNRRGLLAAVTGALTARGINILSVRLHTRADGLAVDSFKVRDTDGEPIADPAKWELIDNTIKRALNGELDVEAAVSKRLRAQRNSRLQKRQMRSAAATRINWNHQSSERNTILEVRTADRLGLAYIIASTLSALNLDIVFAKVATEKNLALDIFYVTDSAGEKISASALPEIETAIRSALDHESVS
ncbi:MAG: [protein-PII] uridylyltransferase [Acidobacteria bacterium]|nr:[protein-PII] uridylyltransferase [Acidobacteriota bacterium]